MSTVQPGSTERAWLIGIIAKAGKGRVVGEAANKEPLCTGSPGTRPRLQPVARAKQTGTVRSKGGQAGCRTETRPPLGRSRSQGLSWELGAAWDLPAPHRESIPTLPRQSLRRGRDGAIPDPSLGQGPKGEDGKMLGMLRAW